jgi:hypothetical protein
MSDNLFIRVRKDGFIYPYNDIMAKNPDCEVITEEEAYPERFVERPEPTPRQRGRKPKVVIEPPPVEEPILTFEELGIEATKGLPT